MSREQLVGVLLRILGIYIIVNQWVAAILVVLKFAVLQDLETGLALLVVSSELALGVYFAFFPMHCVKWLTPDGKPGSHIDKPLNYEGIQTLAFFCLGLYFLIPSLVDFLQSFFALNAQGYAVFFQPDLFSLLYSHADPLVRICTGIGLIFGGKGLMNIVRRLRTVGPNSDPIQ